MKQLSKNPVWISGIGQKTISAGFTKNISLDSMESTKVAGDAGIKNGSEKS